MKVPEEDKEINIDEDEGSDEGESLMNGGIEDEEGEYPEDYDVYDNGQAPEDEEDEDDLEEEDGDEEEEDEIDLAPERTVLRAQGNSADTAIDLD